MRFHVAALALAAILQPQRSESPLDIIIRHGSILDGTGRVPFDGDVGIVEDRIAAIGDLSARHAAVDLDAAGLSVAPGFINIHSHAVADALPTAVNMLTQGVTTEILNPDGGGPTDIALQLKTLADAGLAINVGAYAPFNAIWAAVVGPANRRPTADERHRMRALVSANVERGAWGVSAGLDYKPAYFATTDEVIDVVSVAAPWRTDFTNHDRLTPESGFSSQAGMTETMTIGERAGLVPVITHMKIQGHEQGRADEALAMMDAASARGHYTAADVYPYLAGQTSLEALIVPAWAQDGGRAEMLKRFEEPALRARIAREAEEAMAARFNGPEAVMLPASGRRLVDIMSEMNVGAGEAVLRIVEREPTSAILRFGSEPDLVTVLRHPTTSIACDCGASLQTRTHPRYYGTFPRVLGHYVRETHALTLEDAVRKMTSLPAATIGLVDRGALAVGMAADVTVFDPRTVIDHATYESPALPSDGIRHVIVNGRVALRDGRATGERGGVALVRSQHMPSRPMPTGGRGAVSFRGSVSDARVELDVSQSSATRSAAGTFTVVDRRAGLDLKMTDFGVLQTAAGWAAFTGRMRARDGAARFATVIVDRADPLAADGAASIVVEMSGGYRLEDTVPPARVVTRSSTLPRSP
jgi:N-acyl-D-aspartate/D-glutamate deacylase